MNANILDDLPSVSGNDAVLSQSVISGAQSSQNGVESDISFSGSGSDMVSVLNLAYDEELGGYPVVIVNDMTEETEETSEDIALFSLPYGTSGYQISDYWLEYFRGVLSKHLLDDYLVFSTREYENGYNYVQHYWLYVGDLENGGEIIVYDCYSYNSLWYVDISTENMSSIDVDSYDTLVYSNLGNVSDIRKGDSFNVTLALLFFLAFFAVYAVCRGFYDFIFQRIYRK